MIDITPLCLTGLAATCPDPNIDPAQITGELVRWFEIVGGLTIALSVYDFFSKNKLSFYLLKLTYLKKVLFTLVGLSVMSVVISNILPFIPGTPLLIIGYPYSWEALCLLLLTCVIILLGFFFFNPEWFIPEWKKRNIYKIQTIIDSAMRDGTPPSLGAAARVLAKNIQPLFTALKGEDKELAQYASITLDVRFSNPAFCKYLVTTEYGLLLYIFQEAKKHAIWDGRYGRDFFTSLFRALLLSDETLLDKELNDEYIGKMGHLSRILFTSLPLLDEYDFFQALDYKEIRSISFKSLQKYIYGLKIAIRKYYEDKAEIQFARPLSNGVKNLVDIFEHQLRLNNGDPHWLADESTFNEIENFFENIPHLFGETHYRAGDAIMTFTTEELSGTTDSLANEFAKSIFELFDKFASMPSREASRTISLTSLSWLLHGYGAGSGLLAEVKKKIEALLKERVEENEKGFYRSIIPLLLNIYLGFGYKPDTFAEWINQSFETRFKPAVISDDKKLPIYLPEGWAVKDGKVFDERNRERNAFVPK